MLERLARLLAQLVGEMTGSVPNETIQPAGDDHISKAGAQRLTKQGEQLANRFIEGLDVLAAAAYAIGDAGERYSRADPEAAEAIARASLRAGSAAGRERVVSNPVAAPTPITRQARPGVSTDLPTHYIGLDSLDFARKLESGDKGHSAGAFRDSWDLIWGGTHERVARRVDETKTGLQQWTPVGTGVATLFGQFRTWHDRVNAYAAMLVQQAEAYRTAYDTVRDPVRGHPSAIELQQAKEAMQTGTPEQRAAAMQRWQQLEHKARQAQYAYQTAIESGVPNGNVEDVVGPPADIATPTRTAVNREIPPRADRGPGTNGTRSGRTGNGNKTNNNGLNNLLNNLGTLASLGNLLNQPTATGATTVPSTATPTTATPTTATPNASNANNQANSGQTPQMPDLSQLAKDPNTGAADDDGLLDDPLLAEPLDYASGPGGYGSSPGGGVVSGVPTSAIGVPLVGTGSLGGSKMADATKFGVPAASGRAQAGAGGMPYMPFMPGMGGANANGGDRKNPFAKEEKIVDDDELRGKVLAGATINEKPPVLPIEATKPTRMAADRTSATNEGGTAA